MTEEEYFKKDVTVTTRALDHRTEAQLHARGLTRRGPFLTWLNRGYDEFITGRLADAPVVAVITILIVLLSGSCASLRDPTSRVEPPDDSTEPALSATPIPSQPVGPQQADDREPADSGQTDSAAPDPSQPVGPQQHANSGQRDSDAPDLPITAERTESAPYVQHTLQPQPSEVHPAGIESTHSKLSDANTSHTPNGPSAFNLKHAQFSLLMWAFFLSFSRWHLKGRQDTLTEAFQRKQSTNDFIVQYKGELEVLVSGATGTKTTIKSSSLSSATTLSSSKCLEIIARLRALPDELPDEDDTFVRKMFVFYELDNLEFAFDKYQSDMLEDAQMLRTCEIFESRCLSEEFRRLAITLSTGNYGHEFLCLVHHIAVFAETRSSPPDPA